MKTGQTAGFNFNQQRNVTPVNVFSNVCKASVADWSSKNDAREEKIWQNKLYEKWGK